MRLAIILSAFLALQTAVSAQVMEGMVIDNEQRTGIPGITIFNSRTGELIRSDGDGVYRINASGGDTILFRHTSFYNNIEVMDYSSKVKHRTVLMQPLVRQLKEATIIGLTKFQQDSLERLQQFEHELNKILVPKPKFTGVGCAGCIGWLADKITGNSKKPKRFRKSFEAEDEMKFIDSRYTIELVASQTKLTDTDSIISFIYQYPMEYDFARHATDMELKAFIRNNYRQYLQKNFTKKD